LTTTQTMVEGGSESQQAVSREAMRFGTYWNLTETLFTLYDRVAKVHTETDARNETMRQLSQKNRFSSE
jgi:hypothetical protein